MRRPVIGSRNNLARRNLPSDAVGETRNVKGSIKLTSNESVEPEKSSITVDLASLTTVEPRRDRYVRSNTLKTDEFPVASVSVIEITRLVWPLPSSDHITFQMTTDTTIHAVTAQLTWEVTANIIGMEITGQAKTSFPFNTYNLTPPKLFFILSVEDNIRLELEFVASISNEL